LALFIYMARGCRTSCTFPQPLFAYCGGLKRSRAKKNVTKRLIIALFSSGSAVWRNGEIVDYTGYVGWIYCYSERWGCLNERYILPLCLKKMKCGFKEDLYCYEPRKRCRVRLTRERLPAQSASPCTNRTIDEAF
jgi:hypothetical protein